MRLTPQDPKIPEVGGFTEANDLFGYRDFAERFANLVRNIDERLVIALDGPWGSGKSIFVKQWAGLLREQGATVMLFDAFQNDHYEDAFTALSAEIYSAAKETLGGNEASIRRYLNKAKKAAFVLAPIAYRVAARAGTAGLLSLEDVEAGGEAVKATAKAFGNESAKALERVISERLRKSSEERAVLATFRVTLSQVAASLAQQPEVDGKTFPLVLIIDELDRCRPPFALSIIERIKHLFSVPGVCFVLVTHLPQLETAILGAYGTTFDARTYLEKFYQVRVFLPDERNQPGSRRSAYIAYLWNSLQIEFEEPRISELVQQEVQALADVYDLSLRQLEHVITNVALVCAAAGPHQLITPALVGGLCVMRQIDPALYKTARAGGLTWEEARKFLQPSKERGVQRDWTLNFWRYATGDEFSQEEEQPYAELLFKYNLHDRESLIPFMTNYIDELAQRRVPSEE